MTLTDSTLLYKKNPNAHVIVTYSDHDKLDDLVYSFLNEGLKWGQLCIYGTVYFGPEIFEKMSTKIIDFENNVKNENLLMVDLQPYFLPVRNHDLTPFEELKKSILVKLLKRTEKHVRFYGDLGSYLFENRHFEECFLLEDWWQKSPFEGTKICPYRSSILENSPLEKKDGLINTHDKIVPC